MFSDEFEASDRKFAAHAEDPKWTASDLHYTVTHDYQAYKPDAATTSSTRNAHLPCILFRFLPY